MGKALIVSTDKTFMWCELMHLGSNMWWDAPWDPEHVDPKYRYRYAVDHMNFEEKEWLDWTARMAEIGMNTLILDLGEALQYPSHPELAVKGAWTPDRMRTEIARLKAMGIEVIPKLNFSTCHDAWLGEYHRMVSTPDYYRVCEDVIRDTCEIFKTPRFLHIGFDEEDVREMPLHCYASARQGELWWHDFLWLVSVVEKQGSRAWMWADAAWHHPEEFLRRCPRSVLQSNWYYSNEWAPQTDGKYKGERTERILRAYENLDKAGFEQVPGGTNWTLRPKDMKGTDDPRFPNLVKYCSQHISPKGLKGFVMAPWWGYEPDGAASGPGIVARNRKMFMDSMEIVRRAMKLR